MIKREWDMCKSGNYYYIFTNGNGIGKYPQIVMAFNLYVSSICILVQRSRVVVKKPH